MKLFEDLNLLTLPQIHLYCSFVFVSKYIKGLLPDIIPDFFLKDKEKYTPKLFLQEPFRRTTLYKKTTQVWAVKEWDKYFPCLDQLCSVHTFKSKLKRLIIFGSKA